LAFPNHEHTPAELAERGFGAGVTPSIGPEFGYPNGPSGFRSGGPRAALVAVPEATVNEHHGPVSRQDDVGRAGQSPRTHSEAEPGPMKERPDAQFRGGVARADSRHDSASLFVVECVHEAGLGGALAYISDIWEQEHVGAEA
jgi:hypothetical protein